MSDARFKHLVLDREEQAKRFAERVTLAKLTEAEAIAQTTKEWWSVQRWVASSTMAPGSFLYMCDVFELEPDAVRKAIKDKT